ncbi:MAG: hypothetical protein V1845_04135 [bacterium]
MSSDGCKGLAQDSGLFAIRMEDGRVYGSEGTPEDAMKWAKSMGRHGVVTKAGDDKVLDTF